MHFIFSKLFNVFTSPINWIVGLLVICALLKNPKSRRVAWSLVVCLFLAFTNGQLLNKAVMAWSAHYLQVPDTNMVYQLAIIAGGSTGYSEVLQQVDYNERGDRMTEAIRLYRLGKIKKLYLSGESAFNLIQGISYAPQFLSYMQQMGVDTTDIVLEKQARTTQENIDNLKKLLPAESIQMPVLLITSAWHMRRLMKGFYGSGLCLVPYPFDLTGPSQHQEWQDYLPSWQNAMGWQDLIHEMVGSLII
ncbi:MAG: YdcF family protein [Mariniphaga sp.]